MTSRFKVAASGRLAYSEIAQKDLMGTSPTLNQTASYVNFLPSIGATYAVTPGFVPYVGYSEGAHPVVPSGVFCTDPASPCTATTPWFPGDTLLKQSVSRDLALGIRGQLPPIDLATMPVQFAWNADLYRNDFSNYYYLAPSSGRPEANNIGNVRAQGVRIGTEFIVGRLTTSIDYKYTDARFRSNISLSAPGGGEQYISAGKVIPGQPNHTVDISLTLQVTDKWDIGTTMHGVSSSYYYDNEVNSMKKVPGYFIISFNTNNHINRYLELFGIMENALNKTYPILGGLIPTATIPIAEAPGATDSRAWIVGQPFSLYVGLRYKFQNL